MLTKENNELMCRVEGDAPMGKMLREYWVPACRSQALEKDGDPISIRLFGQNFVAFRASDGRVGIFDEKCPHRGASLLLARNEDCALTCIFHGWKFDVSGKTVSIPTEPEETHDSLCGKVPLKAYPVRESGTIVWVYLGDGEPPEFPMFELHNLPDDHLDVKVAYLNCNWVQGLEGTIDSSHVGVLHQSWIEERRGEHKHLDDFSTARKNLAPQYEVEAQPYGYRAAAIRELPDKSRYTRITEYVAPWYSFIPFAPDSNKVLIISVPVDDEHSAQWYVHYDVHGPIEPYDDSYGKNSDDPNDFYKPQGTFRNRWRQDRQKMKEEGHWTGADSLLIEDFIVQESMGPIVDRSKEYLNSSDKFITQVRRLLLNSVKNYQNGDRPFRINKEINYENIRATAVTIPADSDWRNAPK